MARAGLDLEQLAERLGKKIRTMKAIRSGEIPLAEDVRAARQRFGRAERNAPDQSRKNRRKRVRRPAFIQKVPGVNSRARLAEESDPPFAIAALAGVRPFHSSPGRRRESCGIGPHLEEQEQIVVYGSQDPQALAVSIRGDAMEPEYKEGTIAVVYPSRTAKSGDLVVAWLGDGGDALQAPANQRRSIHFHLAQSGVPADHAGQCEDREIRPSGDHATRGTLGLAKGKVRLDRASHLRDALQHARAGLQDVGGVNFVDLPGPHGATCCPSPGGPAWRRHPEVFRTNWRK